VLVRVDGQAAEAIDLRGERLPEARGAPGDGILVMRAAVAGLELPDSYYAGLGQLYAAKRTLFTSILAKTGLKFTEPQGAYYSLLDISPLGFKTDTEAAEWLIKDIGVAGVPGSSFFREPEHRYIRFHFAKKEDTLRAAGEKLGKLSKG